MRFISEPIKVLFNFRQIMEKNLCQAFNQLRVDEYNQFCKSERLGGFSYKEKEYQENDHSYIDRQETPVLFKYKGFI